MKQLKFLGYSFIQSIKRKPWFTLFLMLIVVFSVVSSGFITKLMKYADPSVYAHDGIVEYNYFYHAESTKGFDEFADFSAEHPELIITSFVAPTHRYPDASDEKNDITISRIIFSTAELTHLDFLEYPKELTDENIKKSEKRMLVSDRDIEKLKKKYPDVGLNSYVTYDSEQWRIIGIYKISDSASGGIVPYGAMLESARTFNFTITSIDQRLSPRVRSQFEDAMDLTTEDYTGAKIGKWIMALLVVFLWAINIYLLFKAYLDSNNKYYDTYKIVGISNPLLFFSMFLESVPITLLGFLAGWGIDSLISKNTLMFGSHLYLQPSELGLLFVCNFTLILLSFAYACIKKIKHKPLGGNYGK